MALCVLLVTCVWLYIIIREKTIGFKNEDRDFHQFTAKYGKSYPTLKEFDHRKSIFYQNLVKMSDDDEINVFGDLTSDEFESQMLLDDDFELLERKDLKDVKEFDYTKFSANNLPIVKASNSEEEQKIVKDWRKPFITRNGTFVGGGAVSEVRTQGRCGACWAIAPLGVLEGSFAIKYGKMIELSEQ